MSISDSPISRPSFWENHVHAWQDTGLSKARYCREHDLIYHQFIYWVSKCRPALLPITTAPEATKFLPVTIKPPCASSALQIKLPSGAIISGINIDSVAVVGALMAQL